MNITHPGLYFGGKQDLTDLSEEDKSMLNPTYPLGWSPTIFKPETGLGLLYHSPLENHKRETFLYNGIMVEFIDFWPNHNCVRACFTEIKSNGVYNLHTVWVPLGKIGLMALKQMEVWEYLSEETVSKLETNKFVDDVLPEDPNPVSKKDRRIKRDANAKLPREINCSNKYCDGKIPYISPNVLLAKAAEKNLSPEDYVNTWKCNKCEPRKRGGKAFSEKWLNLPRELTCSCGNVVKQHPSATDKQAQKIGVSFEEFVKTWKCSKCVPRKRGRAASEKWLNLPREIVCPCGFVLKQHPSMTTKLAEAIGKSFDDYVKEYRCRKCKPETTTTTTTRGRKMSPDSPWFGKAKELKCACGKVQPQHASITDAQAKKAGMSFDDYVSNWKCINCRPAGAKRVRFGKAPNPNFVGIPKETACISCSKVVKLVPSNIIEKADILEITVDELIKNYRCRKCGGKITKADREKHAEKV